MSAIIGGGGLLTWPRVSARIKEAPCRVITLGLPLAVLWHDHIRVPVVHRTAITGRVLLLKASTAGVYVCSTVPHGGQLMAQ